MAYQVEWDMGVVEFALMVAIERLNASHETFGQQEIAEMMGCHVNTVSRATRRLKRAGTLSMVGTPREGYRYRIRHDTRE